MIWGRKECIQSITISGFEEQKPKNRKKELQLKLRILVSNSNILKTKFLEYRIRFTFNNEIINFGS